MYKKYKIKRKGKLNIYLLFAGMMAAILIMSYGYALWSETLKIKGHANIKVQETEVATMKVDIPTSTVTTLLPNSDFGVTSTIVDAIGLTVNIDVNSKNYPSQSGIFTFQFTNETGYQASNGTSKVTITGNTEAVRNARGNSNAYNCK